MKPVFITTQNRMRRQLMWLLALVLSSVGWMLWPRTVVLAGPVTAAPTKVTVYQGVAAISPVAGQIMELGNNGTDIATNNGTLNFIPGTNNGVLITPAGTSPAGGKITLLPPSSTVYQEWQIKLNGNYLQFYTPSGTERFTLGKDGDAHIMGGLCLTDRCITGWSQVGGGTGALQTLDGVLTQGNSSNHPIVIHQLAGASTVYENASGLLDASTDPASVPYIDAGTNLNVFASGIFTSHTQPMMAQGGSALYAENPSGYAGYFSGSLGIQTTNGGSNLLGSFYALAADGAVDPTRGYILEVVDAVNGSAARFTGSVRLGGNNVSFQPVLDVVSTATTGNTVKSYGAEEEGPAVFGTAGFAGNTGGPLPTGAVSSAIRGNAGTGNSYGAFFHGHTRVDGVLRVYSTTGGEGIRLNGSARLKTQTGLWVYPVGSDIAAGRYVYTVAAVGTPARGTGTQLCYEVEISYNTTCVSMYTAGGALSYELR